jgi:DNA-binding IclR family transcriptional regulator
MRKGIQSIEIGATVLRALTRASGPLQLREIGLATGMTPSKVYKYLVSFTAAGLVKQDAISGRYDLGSFSLELGLAAIGRIDEVDVVTVELAKATAEIQRDAHVTLWGNGGPTVVRWKQGSNNISIRVREGTVLPILTTATGRIWASYLPKARAEPLIAADLDRLERESGQPRSVLRDYYEEKIASVRRSGLARSEGERRVGIDAISGPIFNRDGIAFAMTILGPHRDLDLSYDGKMAAQFRAILQSASIQLGAGPAVLQNSAPSGPSSGRKGSELVTITGKNASPRPTKRPKLVAPDAGAEKIASKRRR